MKYTSEILVALPLSEFIQKLESAKNRKHWQKGFISYEHVSGIPGKIGSKMKYKYTLNNKKIELIEIIEFINLPHEVHLIYHTKGLNNFQINHFSETAEGHTLWRSENEFLATSFKLRLMLLFMPGAFKKQSDQYLIDFKNFAENQISINHA